MVVGCMCVTMSYVGVCGMWCGVCDCVECDMCVTVQYVWTWCDVFEWCILYRWGCVGEKTRVLLGRHLSSCHLFQFPFPELCLPHPKLARMPFPWGWLPMGKKLKTREDGSQVSVLCASCRYLGTGPLCGDGKVSCLIAL